MSKMKHTPVPWKLRLGSLITHNNYLVADTNTVPCQMLTPSLAECEANAQLIVEAVNLHQVYETLIINQGKVINEMKAALNYMLSKIDPLKGIKDSEIEECMDRAKQVLLKAKGK